MTDAIKSFVRAETDDVDFVLCEIGGTVGDIEGLLLFEAIRQLGNDLPRSHCIYIHLTPCLIFLRRVDENQANTTLGQRVTLHRYSAGYFVAPRDCPIPEGETQIALFCNVRESAVIMAQDVDTIYAVPEAYHMRGWTRRCWIFGMSDAPPPDLTRWRRVVEPVRAPEGEVNIAIVGKYTELKDAYKSLTEALQHGGIANRVRVF